MALPDHPVELAVAGNEASDLLPVESAAVLAAHRARRAFWTVLDEGPVERCLALLVERHDGGWTAHHLDADAGRENGRTEDGEALARHDGWVYVFGSHFGSKRGPLRPRRAFVARFREDDAADGRVPVRVVRNQFRLHRAINDALAEAAVSPLTPGDRVRERFISATVTRGVERAKSWAHRLAEHDLPVNVEAAAFTPDGTVLLGLRFPVSVDGEPILIEVDGVPGMFDDDPRTWPRVRGAYVLTGVTPPGELAGFRALTPAAAPGHYDAVTGSIDATGKASVLLDEHPEGGGTTCRHVRFRFPARASRSTGDGDSDGDGDGDGPAGGGAGSAGHRVPGELVDDLAPAHNVEGIATVDGRHWYVTDEDHRVALYAPDRHNVPAARAAPKDPVLPAPPG